MSTASTPSPGAGSFPAGLLGILATATMLFAAFTSSILVRRASPDWVPVDLPPIVWVNAAVILASSIALEMARQAARRGPAPLAQTRIVAALVLGLIFLTGQILAWRALAERGVFLVTTPHASFFYMLSAVHGAHVLGGLGALAWAVRRLGSTRAPLGPSTLAQVSVFWHFVGALWLYLLVVLTVL